MPVKEIPINLEHSLYKPEQLCHPRICQEFVSLPSISHSKAVYREEESQN